MEIEIKKSTLYLAGVILFLVVGIYFVSFGSSAKQAAKIQENFDGEVQVVKLYVRGANYVLEPPQVNAGIPVRIEADMARVPGCSRSFVIPEFNVRTVFREGANTITFTPDKKGTFTIACSMYMYTGEIKVI